MFGSAAQIVTEKARSLPALQELSNHQEPAAKQAKARKKAGHRSKFGKFKVDTEKTQGSNHRVSATMKHRDAGLRPRKKLHMNCVTKN